MVNWWSSHGIGREFIRKKYFGSRPIGRQWDNIQGYVAVRNDTNCVNLEKGSKSAWDQELGKIHCITCLI
jgi:5-methylcytosine-specific restriction endonuclease McrA